MKDIYLRFDRWEITNCDYAVMALRSMREHAARESRKDPQPEPKALKLFGLGLVGFMALYMTIHLSVWAVK